MRELTHLTHAFLIELHPEHTTHPSGLNHKRLSEWRSAVRPPAASSQIDGEGRLLGVWRDVEPVTRRSVLAKRVVAPNAGAHRQRAAPATKVATM